MNALDRPPLWRRALDGLGWVQTQVALVLGYFVLLAPWAIGMRLSGRDPLSVRAVAPRWHPVAPPSPEDDERQY